MKNYIFKILLFVLIINNNLCFSQSDKNKVLDSNSNFEIQKILQIPNYFLFDTIFTKTKFVSFINSDSTFSVENISITYKCGDFDFTINYFKKNGNIYFDKGSLDLFYLLNRTIDSNNLPYYNVILNKIKTQKIGVKKISNMTKNIGTYNDKILNKNLMFFLTFTLYDFSTLKNYADNQNEYLLLSKYLSFPKIKESIMPLICFKSSSARTNEYLTKRRLIYLDLINYRVISDQILCDVWKYFR